MLGEDVLLSSLVGWDFLQEKMLKLQEALFCYMLKIWMIDVFQTYQNN